MEKEFRNDVPVKAEIKNSHAYKAISWIFSREGVKLLHTLEKSSTRISRLITGTGHTSMKTFDVSWKIKRRKKFQYDPRLSSVKELRTRESTFGNDFPLPCSLNPALPLM